MMSNEITATYDGWMSARIQLPDNGELVVVGPAGCGGPGGGPSPKDLLVAGYASCTIMAMDFAAKKAGFDIVGARVSATPTWAPHGGSLESIEATMVLPRHYTAEQLDILRQAECACPVANSLRPDIRVSLALDAE